MKSDKVYLEHILDAIDAIEGYVEDISYAQFLDDGLRQDGVIRKLEIIGEAVKNLSSEVTEAYPEIPWRDIAGTRDRLIHEYFGVDIETVWQTITEDLPDFKKQVDTILKEEFN